MTNEEVLQLYNQFNRIHSQFTVAKRKLVCNDFSQPLFPAEMQVLAVLNERPNYTVSDIATHLYMTKSAVSQVVKKLCTKGFLEKQRDRDNERVVLLKMTQLGNDAVNHLIGQESEALGDVLSKLGELSDVEINAIKIFLDSLETSFSERLK